MTAMSDLSQDLIEEILCRVPITSLGAVRSTCKAWNGFSKDRILCKAQAKQQFLGFMLKGFKVCSMRFNLHRVLKEDGEDFVNPSIKKIGNNMLHQVKISQVHYCDGLLLFVTNDNSRLAIWNPYLGQIRWIQLKTRKYTIYAFGYDNNKNHKIVRFFGGNQNYYEVYDFKSNTWRGLNSIPNYDIKWYRRSSSVNGNTYFWTNESKVVEGYDEVEDEDEDDETFLTCFDFTTERFGQFLSLPFQHQCDEDTGILSSIKEEKLAAFNHCDDTSISSMIEIWITTKIDPNALSWMPFLKVDIKPLIGFDVQFLDHDSSFFIDKEKKVFVDMYVGQSGRYKKMAYIIGENGYLKEVSLGKVDKYWGALMCSYVPSLVQIDQIPRQEKRQGKRKWKSKRKEKKRMKMELTTTTTTRR